MNRKTVLLINLSALSASLLAADWTASVEPFLDPTLFTFTPASLGFRFAEAGALAAPGDSTATHLLVEGLVPAAAANVFASHYTAVDSSTGAAMDFGAFHVQLPQPPQLPALASPIVGVVPRAGPWADYNPVRPAQTTVGGASGLASFTGVAVALALQRDGQAITGSAAYTMPDPDTLQLAPFSLNAGPGLTYSFAAATLERVGQRFVGRLQSLDAVPYDSLMFLLELAEGGIAPVDLVVGEWILDPRLGWLFGATASWAWSPFMSWIRVDDFPWLYQAKEGWLAHVRGGPGEPLWLYSPAKQWIHVAPARDGRFRASSTGWQWETFE